MTKPMTQADRDAIRKRADAASKGPWTAETQQSSVWSADDKQVAGCMSRPGCGMLWDKKVIQANADFIAAAREDVPALLDEVKRLKKHGCCCHGISYTDRCPDCISSLTQFEARVERVERDGLADEVKRLQEELKAQKC